MDSQETASPSVNKPVRSMACLQTNTLVDSAVTKIQYHVANTNLQLLSILQPAVAEEFNSMSLPPLYDSLLNPPLSDDDAALIEILATDFATTLTSKLNNEGRFKFLHFLLFTCNKLFVDKLLPALAQKVFYQICTIAALHKDANCIAKTYPIICSAQIFSLVANGQFEKLVAFGMFALFYEAWYEALYYNSSTAVARYKNIAKSDVVALYTACGEKNYTLLKSVFQTLPVPKEACIRLALNNSRDVQEYPEMLRDIISHASGAVHASMYDTAMEAYNQEDYSKFVRIYVWVKYPPQILIPSLPDARERMYKAILSTNYKFVRPEIVENIANTLIAMKKKDELSAFVEHYYSNCVALSDYHNTLMLVWKLELETLFYKSLNESNSPCGVFVAHTIFAAYRVYLQHDNSRLASYYEYALNCKNVSYNDVVNGWAELTLNDSITDY